MINYIGVLKHKEYPPQKNNTASVNIHKDFKQYLEEVFDSKRRAFSYTEDFIDYLQKIFDRNISVTVQNTGAISNKYVWINNYVNSGIYRKYDIPNKCFTQIPIGLHI